MELKNYQQKVINDLETYFEYLKRHGQAALAFNRFWEDRIGPYNPISGEGMQPYKDNVQGAIHVCIKVPTAGGKTFIACNALRTVFNAYPEGFPKAVIWLVPWSNLLDQTVAALSNPDHPYRQRLNSLFNHRVEVYQKKDLLQGANFSPDTVKDQLSVIVMSFSSLRARNKEDRKVYQENGQLAPFAQLAGSRAHFLEGTDDTALINVIRSLKPVLIVDESHNAESELSVEMLNTLNPSFVLDLTATPKENSNIISLVPAIELKKNHMVKLPVIVYNHPDKADVISSAVHLQHRLELLAAEQETAGGKYIRPIVLFQAQPKTGSDTTTFEKLKAKLLEAGIAEETVKIKTADVDELKGINLMARDCPVRYIITINALKEGWDCPFAYILASLADKSSAVDVEQILGRVLRQPYVMKHSAPLLNLSYVLTASSKFNETLQNIVNGLQASGFSEQDYRQRDVMPETMKNAETARPLEAFLFPEQVNIVSEEEPEWNGIRIRPGDMDQSTEATVTAIESIAEQQNAEMEQQIEKQSGQLPDENIFSEMGNKIKRYAIRPGNKELASGILLPRFYLTAPPGDIFGTEKILLSQEALMGGFSLSSEDSKIDFDQASADLFKVDIEQTGENQFAARFTKFENASVKDSVVEYILAKPHESQIRDIAFQVIQGIGKIDPIPDKEVKIFVERVLARLNPEQLKDVIVNKYRYASKIKAKIYEHADLWAEKQFGDMIKIGKISAEPSWAFPEMIVPGATGASLGNSLYEREGDMNQFETSIITRIAGLPNIAFWHRNLGKGKGFSINGFKSNHYPDFIVATSSGNILLIETKGDDRDNSDSEAKCRLGNIWAQEAGKNFKYFMIFDEKQVKDAYTADNAIRLIKQL